MPSLSQGQFGDLPQEPGTAAIPEGHTRYYHQTSAENVEGIRQHGLLHSKAKGIEGPKGIYISHKPFYGDARDSPTVEMHLPEDKGHIAILHHDVPTSSIVAVHEPWHDKARYFENEPEAKAAALAGEHDSLLDDPDYGPAIRYIKQRHGGSS